MKIKNLILFTVLVFGCVFSANAQFGKLKIDKKHVDAASKGVQALTITDAEIAEYCREYVTWMDEHNPVCATTDKDPRRKEFAVRLAKIVSTVPSNLISTYNLDIKAYYVVNKNAFACANGSIRVFAGLMEEMTDEQILAVIGHEIGHIVNSDSKNAFKTALLTSALKDAVSSAGGTAAKLSNSQLGALGEALTNAQFSQKQESAADNYGYDFLKNCGKDPKNMALSLGVLLKLQQEAGATEGSKMDQILSSHPGLDKRIAALEKKK